MINELPKDLFPDTEKQLPIEEAQTTLVDVIEGAPDFVRTEPVPAPEIFSLGVNAELIAQKKLRDRQKMFEIASAEAVHSNQTARNNTQQ